MTDRKYVLIATARNEESCNAINAGTTGPEWTTPSSGAWTWTLTLGPNDYQKVMAKFDEGPGLGIGGGVVGSLVRWCGYLTGMLHRDDRVLPGEMVQYVRGEQVQTLTGALSIRGAYRAGRRKA